MIFKQGDTYEKIVLAIGASLLLAGCGSQNLGPLEDKTTQLRDDNHQLKLKIQELNSEVTSEKEKVKALEKDKNNKNKQHQITKKLNFLKLLLNIINKLLRL